MAIGKTQSSLLNNLKNMRFENPMLPSKFMTFKKSEPEDSGERSKVELILSGKILCVDLSHHESKYLLLSLIFLKFISDAVEEFDLFDSTDKKNNLANLLKEFTRSLPPQAKWSSIQNSTHSTLLKNNIQKAFIAIEDSHSLFMNLFNDTLIENLSNDGLSKFMKLLDQIELGTKSARNKNTFTQLVTMFNLEYLVEPVDFSIPSQNSKRIVELVGQIQKIK